MPFDGLPHALDPEEGFVVAANQAVIGEDYPFYLTDDWDQGYRSTRIRDRIEADPRLSVAEMAALQTDSLNPMADTLVPYLLDVDGSAQPLLPRRAGPAARLGRPPAGVRATGSAAAAYYNAVWSALLRLTFHDELRESMWPEGGQRWYAVMSDAARGPDRLVVGRRVDRRRRRDPRRHPAAAMEDARDELTSRLALDADDWTWGDLHQVDLRTSTLGESGIGLVEWLMNREDYEVGGGSSTVNAMSWDASVGYEVESSPSMRMVVDLADLDASRWISMTGVSGHPALGPLRRPDRPVGRGRDAPVALHAAPPSRTSAEDTLTLVPGPAGGVGTSRERAGR